MLRGCWCVVVRRTYIDAGALCLVPDCLDNTARCVSKKRQNLDRVWGGRAESRQHAHRKGAAGGEQRKAVLLSSFLFFFFFQPTPSLSLTYLLLLFLEIVIPALQSNPTLINPDQQPQYNQE